ncbi:hypothetical protein LPJ53_001937 [Coemansia erecta]|uniref:EngB-type G domain-containing protein n=1 Tax=Coemansia erecta TaxID=147472 RepID=A0A9W7Y4E5_9FUNG|nr:hypothetical protein LPJ53_001937 [Coemansia erecta]
MSTCLRTLHAGATAVARQRTMRRKAVAAPKTAAIHSDLRTLAESLRDTPSAGSPDGQLSNRQLFARLQPDAKTVDKLDMLQLGTEKQGRFERKKWFRYNEPNVKLPHMSFFAGAQAEASFPPASLPEVGFVGRSNVGKSTLVNKLCGSTAARVSDRPGLTQQINFYTAASDFHLVDMPGYGFAYAKDEERQAWKPLIESYIRNRKTLRRVMVLLDARHGIKVNDRDFVALLDRMRVKYQFILTKCDLVHRVDLAKRHLLVSREAENLRNCIPRVMMVSAHGDAGVNELRKELLHTCSLGQKYLADHRKKEVIALTEYEEQLKIFKDTARAKKRRQSLRLGLLATRTHSARTHASLASGVFRGRYTTSTRPLAGGAQTWEAANAKNPAFAIERELEGPKSRKREIGLFVAVAAVTWGLGTVIAFNYQRMTSTPVTAALFIARHNDEVRRELGQQLNFTSVFPWISGDISHLKGFVEIEFDVVGDKGVTGRLVLKSRRVGNQSGEWKTVDFYIVLPDGRQIDCQQD